MKHIQVFALILMSVFTSCRGQNKTHTDVLSEQIAKGDTENKLGDHLWYVFQEKKNNYRFSSNGEGVYFYGMKKSINFTKKTV